MEESDSVTLLQKRPDLHTYIITSQKDTVFTPKIAWFPGWEAYVGGRNSPIQNVNGILGIQVPSGTHEIVVKLQQTLPQRIGNALFVIGIVLCIVLLSKKR